MDTTGSRTPGGVPSPGVITGPDDVAAALRGLREWAGAPSYADIARRVRHLRLERGIPVEEAGLGRVTVYDCFREGRTRLDPELVCDIAEALGAGHDGRIVWRHAAHAATSTSEQRGIVPHIMSLPPRPRPFIGRSGELRRLLAADTARVHLIHGLAGVGKTSLAVTAAHEMVHRTTIDTVVYVDLAGFKAPGRPADAFDVIDGVLRVHPTSDASLMPASAQHAAYLALLAARRTLLLLDDAASWRQIEPLLPRDDTTRVMVTSRWCRDVPSGVSALALDVLDDDAAATLVRPAREGDSADAARELCDLTGRLPLALALAAARIARHPEWSLRDHADTYRERLATLQLDDDVEGALGVTYAELSATDRRVLHLISLHPTAQMGHDALCAITGLDARDGHDALDRLGHAHLVRPTGSGQWEMHSLVQVFGARMAIRHERPADRESAVRRMMHHYIDTAAAAIAATQPGSVNDWYWIESGTLPKLDPACAATWLRREHANLLTVAAWAAEHRRTGEAARLAAVLSAHLWEGGRLTQAVALHRAARSAAVVHRDSAGEALAERNLGMAHVRLSRYDTATAHLQRAVRLFREIADGDGEASAVNNLAIIATMTGDYPLAMERMDAVCAHYRRTGDDEHLAGSLTNIGVIRSRTGDIEGSVEIQEEAAELAARHGWEKREQLARSNIAGLLADSGDPTHAARAVASAQRAVELARRRADDVGLAYAESNLANALHLDGQTARGRELAERVLTRAEELTVGELVTASHNNLGEMLLREGETDAARACFERGYASADEIGEAFERDRARAHLDRLDAADRA